jgi:enoyl-CoA hydratase
MDLETVLYSVADGVARIVLNRPDKHNALNHQLMDDLDAALDAAERDQEVRVVEISGAGPSFCSGYDLKGSYYITPPTEDGVWTAETALAALRDVEARYQRLWNLPKPTVAKIHGNCLAAGCYLQLVCDISVAAEDARFGHPASRWGGVSSMPMWQLVMGVKNARYLLMTGRIVDGREAERLGLITLAVPAAELEATVDGIVQDLRAVSPEGSYISKEGLNTALEIMGVGALFRYHGQLNALGRLRHREAADPSAMLKELKGDRR